MKTTFKQLSVGDTFRKGNTVYVKECPTYHHNASKLYNSDTVLVFKDNEEVEKVY